jgi:signal transduction histidine kinase/DNA-binding response OmpR family regulator
MNETACILIVEDDPHLLQASCNLLRQADHKVLEATTGDDALRMAGEQRPDLILLGVALPDMDSLEICRRIKTDTSLAGSFVVMLSSTQSENRVEGLEAGADGYIVRPIPQQELLARVQALLRIQHAEKTLQRAYDELELRMEKRAAELTERVKELNCLYGFSRLIERPGTALEEILQGTAELLPAAWQYPEITGTRILLQGREFLTENFHHTDWMQACDIVVRGKPAGSVEVCYLEGRPESAEGPFMEEERTLLNAIAERLGRVVERMQAEQALRQNEGLLRTIAANYPAYLSIVEKGEKDLVVGFTSGKQFEREGLAPDDFVGLTVEEVFGEQASVVREHYLKAFGGEEVSFRLFINNQHQSYRVVPLYDEFGHAQRILVVVEDITAREQAEEALRQRTAELQVRNEELDAFAHTVAHDLQNPLGMITGFADVLEQHYTTLPAEDVAQSLRTIVRSGRKMSNIIHELLLLSSVRGIDVDVQPLDMARIVTEARLRLTRSFQEHQAEIVLPDIWPKALGHAPWIEEVWVNYLSNAVKYGGRPPRVELGAALQESGWTPPAVRFWIRDNGPGLAPEEQARLFVPFTRLAQGRALGHGLGLSIVRRIVEKLGGEVGVESDGVPGQGCLFFFTVPAVIEQERTHPVETR